MTNNHASLLSWLSQTWHIWQVRRQQRYELSHWSERDLHDIGLSRSDLIQEIEKPFWRA